MNLEQLQQKMSALLEEARGIQQKHADKTWTAEDGKRAGELSAEITQVGADIDRLKGADSNMSQLGQIAAAYAKPATATDPVTQPAERSADIPPGSLKAFINSEGYQRVAKTGMGQSGQFKLSPDMDFYARHDPAGFARDFPDHAKTLVYTGATANLLVPDRLAGIYRGDSRIRRVRDAFTAGRTNGVSVSFVRENTVTNNAAGFQEATGITAGSPTPPGSAFPESAITFTVASESVKSIGHMIPVTREMLMDVPLMESYLNDRMTEMLDDKIDDQLISGAGGNDLTGLANVSGLTVLDAAYFAANPVASSGQPAENADRLRRARTYLRLVARANATDVLINPYDLENLETERDVNGNYIWNGATGQNGSFEARIGGMRVIETEALAAGGTAYVVARTAFAVLDRMDTAVEVTDANRNWFEHRILALAVWARLAFVPFRPAAAAAVDML